MEEKGGPGVPTPPKTVKSFCIFFSKKYLAKFLYTL